MGRNIKKPEGFLTNPTRWEPNEGSAKEEKIANKNVVIAHSDEKWNEYKRFLRPVLVSLIRCKNILLQEVIFQNSPA